MKGTRVAQRYAKSLLGLAIERNQLEDAKNEMALIQDTIIASKELQALLASPIINTDKKVAILNEVFAGKIGELTFGFMKIITEKRRESLLQEIAQAFVAQYNKEKGIHVATITAASPLDENTRKALTDKIQSVTGGTVQIIEEVNPDLIGGFVLHVDNKQFNGSLAHQIKQLRREFSNNAYQPKF